MQIDLQWVIVALLVPSVTGLVAYIRSQFNARLADKDTVIADRDKTIDRLIRERDEFKDLAWKAVSASESATRVAEHQQGQRGKDG